jgi:type VI secretion system ImpA family protein
MTAELMSLLSPISEKKPAGESLRFDRVYDEIKEAREEEDPDLPVGVWQRELKRADWSSVARLCSAALMRKTKDLQIAAWLTEAWLHLLGFRGLDEGIRLVAALCRDFWNDVYPSLEDGMEARVAPIRWMADKLIVPLKSVPLTAPAGEEGRPQAWKDWEGALYLANLPRSGATLAAADEGAAAQTAYLEGAAKTPAVRLASLAGEVAGTLAALDELEAVLHERCGEAETPSLTPLRQPLLAIHGHLEQMLSERGEKTLLSPAPQSTGDGAADAPFVAGDGNGAIASRDDAYRKLREAAEFLLRTEPHSPVPYLVRRAIAWGGMSLSQLLEELLARNADLATIDTLLGIKRSVGR